jgi:IS5 family transposase
MLVLQQFFNLSDDELEFQVNDSRLFEEFIGLGMLNSIPDATTVAFFYERLRTAGVIEELFELFDQHLCAQGYEGQVVRLLMPLWCPFQSSETTVTKTRPSGMERSQRSC